MSQIREAQVFLTRDCNLRCGHCNLVRSDENELGPDEWKEAYDRMGDIGIETVKLLGGEPTVKEWLPELIEYSSHGSIRTALLSNSMFSDEMMKSLVDSGLWGYFASIDGLDDIGAIKTIGKDAARKSGRGYRMLHKLKERGVPLLAANVVINRRNMHDVPEICRILSDDGFYVNLCTIQHTSQDREFSRRDVDREYLFSGEDEEKLEELAEELTDMKKSGVKIAVPESYIKGMPVYAIGCDWQCENMSQLRIDADGGVMLCNEHRTPLAGRYNILEITPENYDRFLDDWKETRDLTDCDGCYWSCFIQAEDNIRHGRADFHYVNSKEEVLV
jgi:MoaA/NifB/PqqE/SkfB family radical SAM enzyme